MTALEELKAKIDTYKALVKEVDVKDAKMIAFDRDYEELKAAMESFSPDQIRECSTLIRESGLDEEIQGELLSVLEAIIEEKKRHFEAHSLESALAQSRLDSPALSSASSVTLSPREEGAESYSSSPLGLGNFDEKIQYLTRHREDAAALAEIDSEEVKSGEYYSDSVIMHLLIRRFLAESEVAIPGEIIRYQEGIGVTNLEDLAALNQKVAAMSCGEIIIQPLHRINSASRAPHWIATVITKDELGNVHMTAADSMFNAGASTPHLAIEDLATALKVQKANLHNLSTYQQNNDKDCGAWLIENSTLIANYAKAHGGVIKAPVTKEAVGLYAALDRDKSIGRTMRARHSADYKSMIKTASTQIGTVAVFSPTPTGITSATPKTKTR